MRSLPKWGCPSTFPTTSRARDRGFSHGFADSMMPGPDLAYGLLHGGPGNPCRQGETLGNDEGSDRLIAWRRADLQLTSTAFVEGERGRLCLF